MQLAESRAAPLNRRGRKRKSGRRHSCGRLVAAGRDVMAVVLAQPHRCWLGPGLQLDQKAESELGRHFLRGDITEPEYEAGVKYALIVRRYRAVISAADPTLRPEPGSGADMSDDEAWRRTAAYNGAFEAMHGAGQRAQRAVAAVAVLDRPCLLVPSPEHPDGLGDLRRGLQALSRHFGLVRTR